MVNYVYVVEYVGMDGEAPRYIVGVFESLDRAEEILKKDKGYELTAIPLDSYNKEGYNY